MAALEVVGKDRTPVTFQRLAGSFCIIYLGAEKFGKVASGQRDLW